MEIILLVIALHFIGVYFKLYKRFGIWYCFFPHTLFGIFLGLYFKDSAQPLLLIFLVNVLWEMFERLFSHTFPGISSKTEIHARGVEPVVDVLWGMLGGLIGLYGL